MKKISLAVLLVLSLSACGTRVEPNYAGVLMENYGKNGKDDFSLQKGKVQDLAWGDTIISSPLMGTTRRG